MTSAMKHKEGDADAKALLKCWEFPELPPSPFSAEALENIEREVREEAFARGHAEGLAQGQTEIRRLAARMSGLLDSFTRPLAQLDAEVEAALGSLAVRIAGALVGERLQTDPSALTVLVTEALSLAGPAQREVSLHLHPDDLEAIRPLIQVPPGVHLIGDSSLARGDLRLHADALRLDATLTARMDAALASLAAAREKP